MDLKKTVTFLKKAMKINVAIGVLLSFLASAIIQIAIPGTTLLEIAASVIVTAILTWLSYREQNTKGLVLNVYEGATA
jgi:hypothetical protein